MSIKAKTKICGQCEIEQRFTDFRRRASNPDGYSDICMVCTSQPLLKTDALRINGLTFPQHVDSVRDQKYAELKGLPVPPPQYAFYGQKKLDEISIKARVNYLQTAGFIRAFDATPLIRHVEASNSYATC